MKRLQKTGVAGVGRTHTNWFVTIFIYILKCLSYHLTQLDYIKFLSGKLLLDKTKLQDDWK